MQNTTEIIYTTSLICWLLAAFFLFLILLELFFPDLPNVLERWQAARVQERMERRAYRLPEQP